MGLILQIELSKYTWTLGGLKRNSDTNCTPHESQHFFRKVTKIKLLFKHSL